MRVRGWEKKRGKGRRKGGNELLFKGALGCGGLMGLRDIDV